jgi:catechol 2,3-dioxygenase-like lactoylglutathione lyase family enzyme
MDLQCLDHIHFVVPDLARAKEIYGPFLRGEFVEDYGSPEMNAWGGWNTSGGDFIQPIDPEKPVFGGAPMPSHGMTSVSFRVADIDVGIRQAKDHGLTVRSRVGPSTGRFLPGGTPVVRNADVGGGGNAPCSSYPPPHPPQGRMRRKDSISG